MENLTTGLPTRRGVGFGLAGIILLLLSACASQPEKPVPPPTASGIGTSSKYAQWSNAQLELKRAQLRHELDRAYIQAGPPVAMMFAQGDRDDKQRQVEEMEAELLRRDPSGKLIQDSNALLSNG